MDRSIKDLIDNVRDGWIALFHGVGVNGSKKEALKILTGIIKAEQESLKKLRFERKEIFTGEVYQSQDDGELN